MGMKKRLIIFSSLFFMLILGLVYLQKNMPSVSPTNKPLVISQSHVCPANNLQLNASVWIGTYDGKLYFAFNKESSNYPKQYFYWLCSVEEGKIVKELYLGNNQSTVVGVVNNYIYIKYTRDNSDEQGGLFVYDLHGKTLTKVFSFEDIPSHQNQIILNNVSYEGDGSAYFPIMPDYQETPQFVHVLRDQLIEITPYEHEYVLGSFCYYVERGYGYDVERILRRDTSGYIYELPLARAEARSIIPTEKGLLIHNDDCYKQGIMLYYINEAGELIELFKAPQLASESAVTVYGSDVYFSFKRWERYGEIGMTRYKDDFLEGTYRISLLDFSAEKISNSIYDGLYIFDDSGIYACDENGNIYKLDFNGNVIDTVVKVNH